MTGLRTDLTHVEKHTPQGGPCKIPGAAGGEGEAEGCRGRASEPAEGCAAVPWSFVHSLFHCASMDHGEAISLSSCLPHSLTHSLTQHNSTQLTEKGGPERRDEHAKGGEGPHQHPRRYQTLPPPPPSPLLLLLLLLLSPPHRYHRHRCACISASLPL